MNVQKKYVAPNRRMQGKKDNKSKRISTKHFDTQSTFEFPELGAVVSKSDTKDSMMSMNYASATKEEEEANANANCPNAVAPGWVRLHRPANGQGTIEREYGDPTTTSAQTQEQETNWGLTASQSNELNRLVNRWQSDRDIANDYLDQSSPYWGMKHIDDPLSDDDLESEKGSEMSDEDENSEGMDDDYDDH